MRGCFLTYVDKGECQLSGVHRKIKAQIKAFNEAGLNCSELALPSIKSRFLLRVLYRLPWCNVHPVWKYSEELGTADYLYMRRPFVMTCFMRHTLEEVRRHNTKVKIVVEIPTYPYDLEYGPYKTKSLFLLNDKYNRNRMKGIIDYYATLTDDKKIFGVDTIRIDNGIDLDAIPARTPVKREDNTIHLCAVAMFSFWHGYERILNGLADYYQRGEAQKIIIHFVGDGTELPRYKEIVARRKLEDHVVFHGFLSGEALTNIYNLSHIALECFAAYKKRINNSQSLKSREAVARGIPMVTGCPIDIFKKDVFPYYLEFPNDPSVIDFQKIIDFYHEIYDHETEEEVIAKIRKYAYETVDMRHCMRNVIEYFGQ